MPCMADVPRIPPDDKCRGITTAGGYCGRPAGWGTDHAGAGRCKLHGGSAPSGRKAGARMLAEKQAAASLAEMGVREITDPVGELIRIVSEIVSFKDFWAAHVAELGGDIDYTDDKQTENVRAVVGAYERALDRSERALVNLNRLGIEDRLARVQERQVEALAVMAVGVITAVLADLGVTDQRVPELVRHHLELEAGSAAS